MLECTKALVTFLLASAVSRKKVNLHTSCSKDKTVARAQDMSTRGLNTNIMDGKRGAWLVHWKKKWSHFDLKSWVTGGTKIRPGISSYWTILESYWLDIESQFDSNILQLLGIPWSNFSTTMTTFLFSDKLPIKVILWIILYIL